MNLAEQLGLGQGIAIMHKGDLHTKIQEAERVLGLAERFYDDAEAKIDILASHTPTPAQLLDYFETLYPDAPGRISATIGIIPPTLLTRTTNTISTAGNIVLICLVWAK